MADVLHPTTVLVKSAGQDVSTVEHKWHGLVCDQMWVGNKGVWRRLYLPGGGKFNS